MTCIAGSSEQIHRRWNLHLPFGLTCALLAPAALVIVVLIVVLIVVVKLACNVAYVVTHFMTLTVA